MARAAGPATAAADAGKRSRLRRMTAALSIQGLHKSFGELEVLRGIDLDVAEHEVVCLIGASGSGKSTLLRCINLLEPIDAGRILIEGDEITAKGVKVDRIRRRIGIVFQAFNLFPHMSVLDNVTLAPRKVLKLSRAEADAQAHGAARRGSGSRRRRDDVPDRLSGGQQQRVAIVRALAMKPDLLLLDEVTSRARPGARRRGPRRHPRARGGRHDDGHRDPRDGLRARHREPGLLPRRRAASSSRARRRRSSPSRARPRTRQFLNRIIEAGRL